jgi:hypothetical protein
MSTPVRKTIRERIQEVRDANPGSGNVVGERRARLIRILKARILREAFEEEAANGPVVRGRITFHRVEVVPGAGMVEVWLSPHAWAPPDYRIGNPPLLARDLVTGDVQLGDEPDRRFREDPLTALAQTSSRLQKPVVEADAAPGKGTKKAR